MNDIDNIDKEHTAEYNRLLLNSTITKATTGMDISTIRYLRDNTWKLSPSELLGFRSATQIRISKEDFEATLLSGRISRAGIIYDIIYHNCDSLIAKRESVKSVVLSFRIPATTSQLAPVVLVSSSKKDVDQEGISWD